MKAGGRGRAAVEDSFNILARAASVSKGKGLSGGPVACVFQQSVSEEGQADTNPFEYTNSAVLLFPERPYLPN